MQVVRSNEKEDGDDCTICGLSVLEFKLVSVRKIDSIPGLKSVWKLNAWVG